jgi:transcriptional regulator with XRE-family HTH domain
LIANFEHQPRRGVSSVGSPNVNPLGKIIREARQRLNMTQQIAVEELVDILAEKGIGREISEAKLSRIENARTGEGDWRVPDDKFAEALAELYGIDPEMVKKACALERDERKK